MNKNLVLENLNIILPLLIAAYRAARDAAPAAPALSDEEVIALLQGDASRIRATADDFLKRKSVLSLDGPEEHAG